MNGYVSHLQEERVVFDLTLFRRSLLLNDSTCK